MHFLTPRKRATGLGPAHSGTERHWIMTISSVALAVLTPLFVWQVAPLFGAGHNAVLTRLFAALPRGNRRADAGSRLSPSRHGIAHHDRGLCAW